MALARGAGRPNSRAPPSDQRGEVTGEGFGKPDRCSVQLDGDSVTIGGDVTGGEEHDAGELPASIVGDDHGWGRRSPDEELEVGNETLIPSPCEKRAGLMP
jgi:hypothetical protein